MLVVDEPAQRGILRLRHRDAHHPDDDAVAQQRGSEPLRKTGTERVVEHGKARHQTFGAFQRRSTDRVQQDQPWGAQTSRDGRCRHDRTERVPEDHGTRRHRGREVREPTGVLVQVVPPPGQRCRLAETGEVRGDHTHFGKVGQHRFEAVVLAAEAVHGDDGGLSILGPVHPVRGRRTPHLDLVSLHGEATQAVCIRGRHGHDPSLRVDVRLPDPETIRHGAIRSW